MCLRFGEEAPAEKATHGRSGANDGNERADVGDLEHGVCRRLEEHHRDLVALAEIRQKRLGVGRIAVVNRLEGGGGRKCQRWPREARRRRMTARTDNSTIGSKPAEESVGTSVEVISSENGVPRLDEAEDEVEGGHAGRDNVGRRGGGELLEVVF